MRTLRFLNSRLFLHLKKHPYVAIPATSMLLGAILALPATWFVAEAPVSVGLDTDVLFQEAPAVQWGEDGQGMATLEVIPESFSPIQPALRLVPLEEKNPASDGFEVWLGQHPGIETSNQPYFDKRFHPFALGQRFLWYQIHGGESEHPFTWKRDSKTTPHLSFLRTPSSGKVRLTTIQGEQVIDLYAAQESVLTVPDEGLAVARYYARIPRRALSGLRLVLPAGEPATIHRLYVGSLIPQIYFGGKMAYPDTSKSGVLGQITRDWVPERQADGSISVAAAAWEHGGAATYGVLSAAFSGALLLLAAAVALLRWLLRYWVQGSEHAVPELLPTPYGRFFRYFVALLLVFFFYLGCVFPGAMSNDFLSQWQQAHSGEIIDAHPALYTMAIAGIASLWDTPLAVTLVHIVAMSATLAFAFTLLARAGIHALAVGVLFHLALLSPKNGIFAVTLLKDVPFSILVLLLTALLFRLCFEARKGLRVFYWLATAVTLALLPLVRHNGLLILVGLAPLLPFAYWRERRRALLLGTLLSFGLFALVKFGLYPALEIKKWDWLDGYMHTMKTAILIDQDVPLSAEEYAFLNQVRPINPDHWYYHPFSGNFTCDASWNREFTQANTVQLANIFYDCRLRYPLLAVQDYYMRSHYIYGLFHPKEWKVSPAYLIAPDSANLAKDAGYTIAPLLPRLNKILAQLVVIWNTGCGMLVRPALALYLVLLSALITTIRLRASRELIVYAPALFSTCSMLMVPMASQIRYQLPLTLTASFLLGLALLPRRPATQTKAVATGLPADDAPETGPCAEPDGRKLD